MIKTLPEELLTCIQRTKHLYETQENTLRQKVVSLKSSLSKEKVKVKFLSFLVIMLALGNTVGYSTVIAYINDIL